MVRRSIIGTRHSSAYIGYLPQDGLLPGTVRDGIAA
jgi:hypothetical protein